MEIIEEIYKKSIDLYHQHVHFYTSASMCGLEAYSSPMESPGKGWHHQIVLKTISKSEVQKNYLGLDLFHRSEARTMGVCTSSEAKPEKDLYSDGLAKEHFNKEVLGENSDSSIGMTTHGYIVFSDC